MTSHAKKPDWLVVLQLEVDATSQGKVARRLGLHQAVVSRALRGVELSDKQRHRVALLVRHVLIAGTPLNVVPPAPSRRQYDPHHKAVYPPGTTRRTCLKCGSPFPSWGAGNRLCSPCHSGNLREGEHGGIF